MDPEEVERNELFPDWLFDDNHPDSYFMQINHLTYTARQLKNLPVFSNTQSEFFVKYNNFIFIL